MEREVIVTTRAPRAIGPYSQGIRCGGFVFTAGQIALDPETGRVTGASVSEQTVRVLENLRGVLEEAGSSLSRVVKTTVFLRDMEDFQAMNEVYARYFTEKPPARSTVQAGRLPKDVFVEMDAIAAVGD